MKVPCPLCNTPVESGAGVCTECGSPLPIGYEQEIARRIERDERRPQDDQRDG